jgi:hypothetical protein
MFLIVGYPMTKDELIKHMEAVLAERVALDKTSWRELSSLTKHDKELDKAHWHGYASAIESVRTML